MNYLELVNRALQESGKDQDDLNSSNFASPPNPRMYNRFKNWTNESLAQLLEARNEWEFKSGRAVVNLYPALYVKNGEHHAGFSHGHGSDITGATIIGDTSGFTGEVVNVVTHSGSWNTGTAKATLYFSSVSGNMFVLGETFDETAPDPETNVCTAGGWGRYYFGLDGQVPTYKEIMISSVRLQTADDQAGLQKLVYVDWDRWAEVLNSSTDRFDQPQYFTIAPDNGLEFFPRPDKRYTLTFEYAAKAAAMVDYDDIPDPIPEAYHMAIVWATVEKSGMYDRDKAIVARAQKEYRFYRDRLERHYMPDLNFGPSRFDNE